MSRDRTILGPLGNRIKRKFLESGEKPSHAEPKHIETKGDKWAEETAKGWVDSMMPDATPRERRRAIRRMKEKLRPHIEEWERSTWKGIRDFVHKGKEVKREEEGRK